MANAVVPNAIYSDSIAKVAEAAKGTGVPDIADGGIRFSGDLAKAIAAGAIVHQLMGGLRASMGYTGSIDMETMRTKAAFVRVTTAGMSESHLHDVSITKEAPNYPVGGR